MTQKISNHNYKEKDHYRNDDGSSSRALRSSHSYPYTNTRSQSEKTAMQKKTDLLFQGNFKNLNKNTTRPPDNKDSQLQHFQPFKYKPAVPVQENFSKPFRSNPLLIPHNQEISRIVKDHALD